MKGEIEKRSQNTMEPNELQAQVERGGSQLIGGFLVIVLAFTGWMIGYSSMIIQWVATSFLGIVAFFLTISGFWTLIRKENH
ncbi:MAG: hypothetical protein TUN42_05275 [Dehalogenimonas sp.]